MKTTHIALDGPGGAGKSTIAKKLSEILNIEYLDTGSMYRALTKYLLDNNINYCNNSRLEKALEDIELSFVDSQIHLNGINVEKEIRNEKINSRISEISSIEKVRNFLVNQQREIAKNKSIILDGRDIGTVVLPNADYKFFITASLNERSKRRHKEINGNLSLEQIENSLKRRDEIDSTRKIAPLKKAEDAIEIDTTNLDIDEVVGCILEYIKR